MKMGILIWIVLLAGVANAELEISQVMYDADGADEGFEFIEIHNLGEDISLEGYSIEYSSGDSWSTVWSGSKDSLTSNEFYIVGEINESNSMVDLNMLNTRGAVRLMKEGVEIDLVGYGESTIYYGLPAVDVTSGKSLVRTDNTGNNFADFVENDVLIRNFRENVVKINVLNAVPSVLNYSSVFVDNLAKLDLEVTDLNGIEDINLVETNCSGEVSLVDFNSSLGVNCTNSYSFRVWDLLEATSWFDVTPLEMFSILGITGCDALPGGSCNIGIESLANLDLNVSLSIDKLTKGSSSIDLNSTQNVTFDSGENKVINFDFDLPTGLSSGEYVGDLVIRFD